MLRESDTVEATVEAKYVCVVPCRRFGKENEMVAFGAEDCVDCEDFPPPHKTTRESFEEN